MEFNAESKWLERLSLQSHDVPPNTTLLHEGFAVSEVFVLSEGFVKLQCSSRSGITVTLDILGPGSLIGNEAVLLRQDSQYSVISATSCRFLKVHRRSFRKACTEDHEVALGLHRTHAKSIELSRSRILVMCAESLSKRAEFSLRCLLDHPSYNMGQLRIPLAQRELASLLGVTPEHFCRALQNSDLQRMFFRRDGGLFLRRRVREMSSSNRTA